MQLFPYPFCPTSTMDMNQPRLIKRRTSKNADPGAILILKERNKMETFAKFEKLSQRKLEAICGGKSTMTTTTITDD